MNKLKNQRQKPFLTLPDDRDDPAAVRFIGRIMDVVCGVCVGCMLLTMVLIGLDWLIERLSR
ncbi:MAG TPA: hypothetical protein VEH27_00630 [Methylomirabilota bacterium]|nr:hypothetical protein [Methylomirabilota bacterium]